jgi:hypothetical protein
MAAVRGGLAADRTGGTLLIPPTQTTRATNLASLRGALFYLWLTKTPGRAGHWADGLDTVLRAATEGGDGWPQAQQALYQATQEGLSHKDSFAKVALADFITEGFEAEGDTVSALAFAVLHDLLGPDAFFAAIRGLRAELGTGYADLAAAGEYLEATLQGKEARKFVKNWFLKGTIGKDMAKSRSFSELVARYR